MFLSHDTKMVRPVSWVIGWSIVTFSEHFEAVWQVFRIFVIQTAQAW